MHGKHVAAAGAVFAVPAVAVPAALAGALAVSAFAGPDAAPPAGHAAAATAALDAVITSPHPDGLTAKAVSPVSKAVQEFYTVVSGDTLSGIAGRFCGSQGKWPSLYHGNHGVIGASPDMIRPGQKFTLSCDDPALLPVVTQAAVTPPDPAPVASSGGKVWGVTYGYPNYCGDGDGDGWDVACQAAQGASGSQSAVQQAPVQATAAVTGASGTIGGGYPGGSFGACVVARESGGNAQVMNSTGHYGLYQFSYSTWVAYGGNGADFGNASAAEQEQVFANAMATPGGASNWSPYDGC